jgi:polyferredoxin
MLAVFCLFFLLTRRDGGWPPDLVNLPFRLDPLAMLAHLLPSRTFLAASALALITLGLSFVFGRAWCGWICPLGTTLDLIPLKRLRGDRRPPAEGWRRVKYILLTATLTAALLGNLTLLAFDPLTLLSRSLTTALWPGLDRLVLALEKLLFRVPFLSEPVAAFDAAVRPALFPAQPVFFRDALLFGLLFAAVVGLNAFAERFWCRYLCPLGGLLGLLSKVAVFRRTVGEDCPGCVLCTHACPTGTIDPGRNYASDPSECTLCLDCLETCPRSRIEFTPQWKPAAWQPYDPGRRAFLATAGLSASAVALTRAGMLARREPDTLIRPPGMREVNPDILAVTQCIRCSACMRACPTAALQPGVFEAGLEGFGAPLLIPRLGYCDFSCNACGQVCPTGAIPPLDLETKRLRVIGAAYIDQDRCLPWADGNECFVCEEMCPLPEKAIELRARTDGQGPEGVRVPYVNRDVCIGCGICEYQCPVNGQAAIRISIPQVPTPF